MFSNIYSSHAFVYDSNFAQLYKSEYCGAIIDNRYYAPICVLEEKDRKRQYAFKMCLGFF